jgi:ribosomal protein S1
MIGGVWDFGGGEGYDDRAARARAAWPATTAALPIGTEVSGTVVNRQPFGVFVDIDGHPDALGLADIVRFPREVELPAPGTPIVGRVISHSEHNHQVRIEPTGPRAGATTGGTRG